MTPGFPERSANYEVATYIPKNKSYEKGYKAYLHFRS